MSSYTPVTYDFRELLSDLITTNKRGKIFFFTEGTTIDEKEGEIQKLVQVPGQGEFIHLKASNETVRIDRIITIFGKPGPAYDEYDAYGNSCMDCTAGFEKNDPRLD